uniref:HAT C-terminal dimerisation domain-containing protein n=1 Tax=Octopus bimaculoides TaxID=37653 RepID=A0A0L8GJ26_OCTBM
MRQQPDKVSNNRGSSNNEKQEDDFLSGVTQPKESSRSHRSLKDKAQNLVKTWLETNSKELLTDAALLGEQVLVDLFIKFNTAIPSSAAVECLFSMGKDILRAKSSLLSDENFDMLIFMKGNMHLMNKMENEKKRKN